VSGASTVKKEQEAMDLLQERHAGYVDASEGKGGQSNESISDCGNKGVADRTEGDKPF